ncbi:DoxX family protein [Candidatus Woesearchaeota archaeon]|nr:DoxX family protein [Candidatus Woesearchaeota archaeon]
MIIWNIVKEYENIFYLVFRVFVGLLFAQHGAQKLFGMFGREAAELFSLMGFVGFVEFFGGLAIVIGLLTRLAAFGGAAIMVAAYFTAHAGKALVPILNGGELALMYLVSLLIIMVYGAKAYAIEYALWKKEVF